MTNGEKIREVFPNLKYEVKDHTVFTNIDNGVWFSLDWWNAEYKEPTTKKCTTCAYREIDGKPHEMCKSCVCGNRYKQEPTNKNDLGVDCVSRKEVLKIYDEWFATCNIADKKESPKAKINALPLVTPIRPKGRWIKVELPSRDAHECSECGNLAIFDECRNEEMLTDFCPNCGAKMEEV
jgi:hypothetical protein